MVDDFLLERRLNNESPELSRRFRNVMTVVSSMLEKVKPLFPDFTDHSLRHVTFVTQFANTLIGHENIDKLNIDEIFILLMACALHDIGMTIGDDEFERYHKGIVPDDYFDDPANTKRRAVRYYHQDFSAYFVRKFAELFEIPGDDYTYCIAQTVKGHRRADLYDENEFNPKYILKNGNTVCLPYLSAIIRLADELDIARDRNPIASYEEHAETLSFKQHYAVRHMNICDDCFELEVDTRDDEVWNTLVPVFEKLQRTLDYAVDIIDKRSDFTFKWNKIAINRVTE